MGRVPVAIIGGCVVDLTSNGRSGKVLLGHWVEGVTGCYSLVLGGTLYRW